MIAPKSDGGIHSILAEWIDDLLHRLHFSPVHVRTCERVMQDFFRWGLIESLDQIEPVVVMRYLRHRSAGVARKTVLNDMSAIRTFADWCCTARYIEVNRIGAIRLPRAPKSRGCSPFTVDEVRRLIATAERLERSSGKSRICGPLRSTWYRVMTLTGLRFGEMAAQEWVDVDLDRKILRVTKDKARRGDVLPLTDESIKALERWRRYSTGAKVFEATPCIKSLRRDMKLAGIEPKSGNWHRFRKCLITTLRRAGADLNDLCRIGRHVDPRTTMQSYDLWEIDDLRRVAQLFPDLSTSEFSLDTPAGLVDKARGDVHSLSDSCDAEPLSFAALNVANASNAQDRASDSSPNGVPSRDQRTAQGSNPWVPLLLVLLR